MLGALEPLLPAFAFSIVTQIAFFAIVLYVTAHEPTRAAALTLLCAVVTFALSVQPTYHYFQQPISYTSYVTTEVSSYSLAFFLTFLVLDLGLGRLFYPSYLGWVNAYVHHSVYFLFFAWLGQAGLANVFSLGAFTEISTVILSLGKINKAWRQ